MKCEIAEPIIKAMNAVDLALDHLEHTDNRLKFPFI
jgi:hypothetical protein